MRPWRRLLLAVTLGLLCSCLAGMGEAAVKPVEGPVLTISGLSPNKTVRGTVRFTVAVDAEVQTIYAYSVLLPWTNGTSYSWGTWSTKSARDGRTVSIVLDSRLLPEGLQAVTFYTRDRVGRIKAAQAFSLLVSNDGTKDFNGHVALESPSHLGPIKTGEVEIQVRTLGTGKVVGYEYRVVPLGGTSLRPETVLDRPRWDITNFDPGYYLVTVWALDTAGRRIDKVAATVEIAKRQAR